MAHVLVFDLETVPDLERYAAVKGLAGQSAAEIRADLGDKFPKQIYHSIICIGAVLAHLDSGSWIVDAIGAPHVGERTEKDLIAAFVEKVGQIRPQLITFNGNSFDLPVLRYRAMIHGIAAPGLACRPYFHRYTSDAVDLCDVLSSFSPSAKTTLDEFSKMLGLPGKPVSMHGGDVEAYFKAGRIKEIADYCETDVINTFRIWLRHELFCGRLSSSAYEESEQSLLSYIRSYAKTKQHLLTERSPTGGVGSLFQADKTAISHYNDWHERARNQG